MPTPRRLCDAIPIFRDVTASTKRLKFRQQSREPQEETGGGGKRRAGIRFQVSIILRTSLDQTCWIARCDIQNRIATMSQLISEPINARRTSPRQRRLNGAKIIFNSNSVIDCVVRDLSPRGARLLVASPIGIPEQFDLRIDRTGVCHPSKVAWRKADKIGVVFLTGDGL